MEKQTVSVQFANEVEDITRLIKSNHSSMTAINEAMMYGTRGAEDYLDAIALFVDNMYDLLERMDIVCESIQIESKLVEA